MEKRYLFVDISKVLLMFLVLIGHVFYIFIPNNGWPFDIIVPNNNIIVSVESIIYSFHMSAFFLISGFLFYKSFYKYDFKTFVKKKLIRLVVPLIFIKYFVWQPINMIINQNYINIDSNFLFNYIFNFDLGHLWFILVLFIFEIISYIIFKFLFKFDKKNIFFIIIFISSLLCSFYANNISQFFPIMNGIIYNFLYYFMYFLLGIVVYKLFTQVRNNKTYIICFISSLILSILITILNLNFDSHIVSFVTRLINSLAFIFIMKYLELIISSNKFKEIIGKFSNISMAVYLWHQVYIYIFIYIWPYNFDFIFCVSCFVISFLLSLCSLFLFNKLKIGFLDGYINNKEKIL